MALETHRKALRAGLPWIVAALGLLAAGALLQTCLVPLFGATGVGRWAEGASTALGALGSGAMLLGALSLARARAGGRRSIALGACFLLWLAELVARLWELSLEGEAGATLAIRLIVATFAMLALSHGMIGLLARQDAREQVAAWRTARTAFAALAIVVAAVLVAAAASGTSTWPWLQRVPFGVPLAWIVFVLPWLAVARAVRRSVSWVGRRQSVAEVLTG